MVSEKKFREDLFFRLTEVNPHIPPLRERQDEIEFFANKFLAEAFAELDTPSQPLADQTGTTC